MRSIFSALLALASAPASANLPSASADTPAVFAQDNVGIRKAEIFVDSSAIPPVEVPNAGKPRFATLAALVDAQNYSSSLSREVHCLAAAIYFEARGEPLAGQLAVGRVIVARAQSGRFPISYCGVVYQPSQFSFVSGGGSMPAINTNSRDWRKAVAIAQIADAGSWPSPAEGALFFHAANVSPVWPARRVTRIENHIFYR